MMTMARNESVVFKRRGIAACFVVACAMFALLVCGCSQQNDANLAARWDTGTLTEDEVTKYTADFRDSHKYTTDEIWAQYQFEQGLTAKTWRERAIGTLVEEKLVMKRAEELGIKANEEQINAQIQSDKANAGIDEGDAEAWKKYLDSRGMTEQSYRESLEKASIEYQLFSKEISLDTTQDQAVLDEYINKNLLSRVVRRYSALIFGSREKAQAALDDMSGLSGSELATRFAEWAGRDDSDDTKSENGGDMGWDIATSIPFQNELNEEMVPVGELSKLVHEADGKYYVLLCTNYYAFVDTPAYNDVSDADLKSFILTAATYDNWSKMTSDYIGKMREAAHVQIREMPEELPYNVDSLIEKITAEKTDSASTR